MIRKKLVLLVDDDPICIRMLDTMVKSLGYNTVIAKDGQEALDQAAKAAPDVILLDVMMPVLDGFQTCAKIRSSPMLREIPVLMVTALMDRDSRLKALELGADEFISKPYDRAELTVRLKSIIKLNRYHRNLNTRIQFSWVLNKTSEGYLMLTDEDAIHYANPAARRLLGVTTDANQPVKETFSDLARKQFQTEPVEAWENWPNLSDSAETEHPRFLAPAATAEGAPARLRVEIINFPFGVEASRLVRLEPVVA